MTAQGRIESGALGQSETAHRATIISCALVLVALAPAIFALASWNTTLPDGVSPLEALGRRLSLPILLIEMTIVLAAMADGFTPMRAIGNLPRASKAALLGLLVIGFGTALFVAPQPGWAMMRTAITLLHGLFALAAAWLVCRNRAFLRQWLWPMVVVGTVAYGLTAHLFVMLIPDPARFDWANFGLAVVNVRQIGYYAVVGTSASLGLAAVRGGRRGFMVWTALAALLFSLSFWSGTRSSVIAAWGAVVVCAVLVPRLRTTRAVAALLISTATGAVLSLLNVPPSGYFGLARLWGADGGGADAIASGRIPMWTGTLRAIFERPLFGYGEGQFRFVVPESLGFFNHPHNSLLQIALQWGLVGLALTLLLFGTAAGRIFEARNRDAEDVPALLVAASLLIYSFYEGTLYHPYPIMMLTVAAAFLIGRPTDGGIVHRQAWRRA